MKSNPVPTDLQQLLDNAPSVDEAYDTATAKFHNYVSTVKQYLQRKRESPRKLDESLRELGADTTAARTAIKLIEGEMAAKRISQKIKQAGDSLTITLVQPMYHEGPRISPRTKANPHGENALTYKLDYALALQSQYPNIRLRLLMVDDGCDGNGEPAARSGSVAQSIIDNWQRAHPNSGVEAQVIFLDDAIVNHAETLPKGIKSVDDSQKGGSVLYGLAFATQAWKTDSTHHLLLQSDADLSVHPGQIPTIALCVLENKVAVAAGSRREPESVSFIIGAQFNRGGKFFAEIWQRLLPTLARQSVKDITRGFVAIDQSFVPVLLENVQQRGFAYQIEVLLLAAQARSIKVVPVAFIDSKVLSTRENLSFSPKFHLCQAALAIARHYGEKYDTRIGDLIDRLARDPEGDSIWSRTITEYATLEDFINGNMGRTMGLEPTTFGTTTRRSTN